MCKISRILVVDENSHIAKKLKELLELEKHSVAVAVNSIEAEKLLKAETFDIIICDTNVHLTSGRPAYERYIETYQQSSIILMAQNPTVDWAVETIKKGVYDIICKPIQNPNKLFSDIREISNKTTTDQTKGAAPPQPKQKEKHHSAMREPIIIGNSKQTERLKEMIRVIAPTDARVLITGANGTGKELVAKCIHAQSGRKDMPLIEVNCAAIPNELIESEMFGHEKGSFTGAISTRKGRFDLAHGGTIFLDEIGDMSLQAQSKLLRVLQENRITRVGGEKDIEVDVRVIAATNKNLIEEIDNKNFREDLYHRLSVVALTVPTLDERSEDIPVLVEHFLKEICKIYHKELIKIEDDALEILKNRHWRGNIRELHNIVERLALFSKGKITATDVKIYVEGIFDEM